MTRRIMEKRPIPSMGTTMIKIHAILPPMIKAMAKAKISISGAQAGMADREAEKPIERNTIFRLYSMTKPITAVAPMILMERGMLDLYEPVADILPAFAH